MNDLMNEMMDAAPAQDEMSLVEFEKLCAELFEQRAIVDKIEAELKIENGRFETMKQRILKVMEATNKDKHSVKGKGSISVQQKMSVRVPTGEEKYKFAEYLESIGIEKELRTYNSATINAWYKNYCELHLAQGHLPPPIPGIEEPKPYKLLSIRKG